MWFHRVRTRIMVALFLTVLVSILGGEAALAKKKGGDPPPPPVPGTIYFYKQLSNYAQAMRMNGDGSGKQNTMPGEPSYARHSNSRWFLIGGYGNGNNFFGNQAIEIFAINESGQEVQLTDNLDMIWSMDTPSWAKDDSFVSFTALMNTPQGITGGLFVIEIDWSLGFPVAGSPTLVLADPDAINLNVHIYAHDWSPAGNEVVFETDDQAGLALHIATFSATGVSTRLLTTGTAPEWSPDGARIAFNRKDIWTIKPDGTNPIKLTQSSQTITQSGPTWSPDGTFLAYAEHTTKGSKTTRAVMRIPSGGGSAVNLTSGFGNCTGARWRP